jgi:hypothetical protein
MRRLLARLVLIACALAVAMGALAGCGDDDGGGGGLASLAPPDTPMYAEALIRPGADQANAIESFTERAGGISEPGTLLTSRIDAMLATAGIDATYADDVEPWLGDHAAVYVSSFEPTSAGDSTPDFAVLLEVDDAEAARDFLQEAVEQDPAEEEQQTYEDTEYFRTEDGAAAGVVDDKALVLGTEAAFQVAVDSSQGESLGESPEYTERVDALPGDSLGTLFFEPAATVEAVIASEGVDPATARMWAPLLDGLVSAPVAVSLTATPDSASLDLAAMLDSDVLLSADPSLLTGLPADAWLAVAVPELGQALQHGLDQLTKSGLPGAHELEREVRDRTGLELRDVFAWLGDAAVFIAGTQVPRFSAGLIAETSDPAASKDTLTALERLPGVQADVVGDQLVATRGTTVDQALRPDATLDDSPEFQAAKEALGDDFPAGLYLDLPAFFTVAEQGSDGDVDYDAIRPYTQAFQSVIAGSRVDGDLVLSRLTVSLAGE